MSVAEQTVFGPTPVINDEIDSIPDDWSCDADQKRSKVEILVNTTDGIEPTVNLDAAEGWLEIPTAEVETWVERSNSADVKRTSKVHFPTSIHGRSVRDVIGSDGPVSGFARTFHKNDAGDWVLVSSGYYGAVGGTENRLESKLWIYDFAEVCKSVYVDATFNDPSVTDVARSVGQKIVNGSFVPVNNLEFRGGDFDEPFITGVGPDGLEPVNQPTTYYNVDTTGTVEQSLEAVESIVSLGRGGDTVLEQFVGGIGNKSFDASRDTIVDVLNWYADRIGGTWHFEPNDVFTTLVFDVEPVRRKYAQKEYLQFLSPSVEEQYHDTVTVEVNDALYETKPLNTLQVRGRSPKSLLEGNFSLTGGVETVMGSEEFPIAEVRADPLYSAADETRMGPTNVESDATTEQQAVNDAISELRKRLADGTEGNIQLRGFPYINPYDRVDAFETCGETVETDELAVTYEVVGVKHHDSYNDFYRTEIDVKPTVSEEDITVTERRMAT
jgi:hypothetical protein